jgi:hypothetical protein
MGTIYTYIFILGAKTTQWLLLNNKYISLGRSKTNV